MYLRQCGFFSRESFAVGAGQELRRRLFYQWCFWLFALPGHQNASSLISRLFVRIVVERAEFFQLSIPVLDSTIFSVSSDNVDAVVKFLLELVVLVRSIIYLFRRRLFRQVICALGVARTLNGLTRLWEFMTELLALIRRIIDFLRRRKSSPTLSVLRELRGHELTGISTGYDDFIISLATPLRLFGSPPCPPASWRLVFEPSQSTARRSGD